MAVSLGAVTAKAKEARGEKEEGLEGDRQEHRRVGGGTQRGGGVLLA